MPRPVAIIGTGNVAHHLVNTMYFASIPLAGVCGRSIAKAKKLAEGKTAVFEHLKDIPENCICIVAIKDDALPEVLHHLKTHDIAHTSGSIPMAKSKNGSGVFYPLQTFSKSVPVDMSKVPFLIEANSQKFQQELVEFAKLLSNKVLVMNSETRSKVHLAAVVACNFSNHMYALSQAFLSQNDLDNSILQPLIEATALKLRELPAHEAQTGPAVRNDQEVLQKHIEDLKDKPELQEIYTLITKSIQNHHGQ